MFVRDLGFELSFALSIRSVGNGPIPSINQLTTLKRLISIIATTIFYDTNGCAYNVGMLMVRHMMKIHSGRKRMHLPSVNGS